MNNQKDTIKDIEKYMEGMENETSSQPYKPFFTLYAKKRHWLNLMRFIFGEYKYRWFEKDKQPIKYKNAFELVADSIDLDVKDIKLVRNEYKCASCQNIYEKGWSDEEAKKESIEIWGDINDFVVICDDCYSRRTSAEINEMGKEYQSL